MRWLWSLTAVALLSLLLGRAGGPPPREQRPIWVFYDTTVTNAHAVQQAIVARGGRVRYASRWLHAVSAELEAKGARDISGALQVQPVARLYAARVEETVAPPSLQQQDSASYGPNFGALREMGVPQLHALNFTTSNVRIASLTRISACPRGLHRQCRPRRGARTHHRTTGFHQQRLRRTKPVR
jgi:hypothetical protein